MSLCCHQCGIDVQPSNTLPAREGGMLYPNVAAAVWLPDGERWQVSFTVTPDNRALCFECIIKGMADTRMPVLKKLFAAYQAEVRYRRAEIAEEGVYISARRRSKTPPLYEKWKAAAKRIPLDQCLCCGNPVPGEEKAYFTFLVMDRALAGGNTSIFGSYQFSNIKLGNTGAKICFSCCKSHFSRIFEALSCDLRGEPVTNFPGESALFVSEEILDALVGTHPTPH